jgi:antitoxin YefM
VLNENAHRPAVTGAQTRPPARVRSWRPSGAIGAALIIGLTSDFTDVRNLPSRIYWYNIQYQSQRRLPVAITASEARKNLFPLIEKVNDDRTPIEITSRRGDAVLLSREDYEALEETAHLLRVPANARRLIESLQQALSGQREEHDLAR